MTEIVRFVYDFDEYLGRIGVLMAGELGTLMGADMVILGGFDFLANGMSLGSVGVNDLPGIYSWCSLATATSGFAGDGIESIHC